MDFRSTSRWLREFSPDVRDYTAIVAALVGPMKTMITVTKLSLSPLESGLCTLVSMIFADLTLYNVATRVCFAPLKPLAAAWWILFSVSWSLPWFLALQFPTWIAFLPSLVGIAGLRVFFRSRKAGVEPEWPAFISDYWNRLVHACARNRWKYRTSLRFDFWLIWIGMWIPVLLFLAYGTVALSGRPKLIDQNIWSQIGYGLVTSLVAYFSYRLMASLRNRRQLEDLHVLGNGLTFFIFLLISVRYDGSFTWLTFGYASIATGVVAIPFDALEKYLKRTSRRGKQEYEQLEAPSLGL